MKTSPFQKLFWVSLLTFVFGFSGSALSLEIEVDPIAYALKGYSLHLVYPQETTRFDVGVFAIELPEDSDNANFDVYFQGYGLKWDYFGKDPDGLFAGIQASVVEAQFTYNNSSSLYHEESTSRTVNNYGVRIGYRFGFGNAFVSPWISVDYNEISGEDVKFGDETYQQKTVTFFPTVHLGYRF